MNKDIQILPVTEGALQKKKIMKKLAVRIGRRLSGKTHDTMTKAKVVEPPAAKAA